MKRLFEKKKELAREMSELTRIIDVKIQKRWGFSYSDTDDDQLIGALDYGEGDITYSDFVKKMDEYKKNLEEDGKFGTVY